MATTTTLRRRRISIQLLRETQCTVVMLLDPARAIHGGVPIIAEAVWDRRRRDLVRWAHAPAVDELRDAVVAWMREHL